MGGLGLTGASDNGLWLISKSNGHMPAEDPGFKTAIRLVNLFGSLG